MMIKKITAIFTTAAVLFSSEVCLLAETVQEVSEENQYVIVAGTEEAYETVCELAEETDSITTETPVLSVNHVMVAELTAAEARDLDKKDGILVEEDFILTASTAEEEDTEEKEYTKEEIIQMKQERHKQIMEAMKSAEEGEIEYEWNLQAIHADESAAQEGEEGKRVKIALLDSGVDFVSGINLEGQINLVEDEQDLPEMFQDLTGHGTGIAGIIAGNGETGIYGVNPNAELYSVKVLDGENKAPISRIIQGIYWCIENDIRIINMSFGTPVYSRALKQAVADAYAADILMVSAAGNESGVVEYPAAFDEVMAVAATDTHSNISDFSNTGEELDIAAPGEKIRTAGFFDGCVVTHGTSIAVPHVTGAASLLWEKDLTKSNEFIRQLINSSAKDINGTDECGLLDVGYAEKVYDEFAENFDGEAVTKEIPVTDNAEAAVDYGYIDEDEAYVEGRWSQANHQDLVEKGNKSKGTGFTDKEIERIKKGIAYPDQTWKGPGKETPWHGRWMYRTDKESKYRRGVKINYAAVVQLATSIALKGGDTSTFTDYKKIKGMDPYIFNDMKTMINTWCNSDGKDFTKKERKLFLYGCGMHPLTDLFAHSATNKNGTRLSHEGGGADNTTVCPRRYKAAAHAAAWAVYSLSAGIQADGLDILFALDETYTSDTEYHLINAKQYITENGYAGYYDAVLNKANIDKPVL